MFIRYNETSKYYEYDTSAAQNGTGPWLILPIDYAQIYNPPPGTSIPPNIAFTDVRNIFTADQEIQKAIPAIVLTDTGEAANAKKFRLISASGKLFLQAISDDETAAPGFATIDRLGNVSALASFFEKARSVALGHWQDVPFNAADFTSSSGSWTIGSAAIIRNRYTVIGQTMHWSIYISWFSGGNVVSGTPAGLTIKIPGGFTCPGNIILNTAYGIDGARVELDAGPSGTSLGFNKRDGSNFTNGGAVGIIGTFTFEIVG